MDQAGHTMIDRAAELGRLWLDLVGEQARLNLETVAALGGARSWGEVAEAQGALVRSSLDLLGELGRRYLDAVQGAAEAVASAQPPSREAA